MSNNYFYYGAIFKTKAFKTKAEKKKYFETFYKVGHEAVVKMAQDFKEQGYNVDSKDWL